METLNKCVSEWPVIIRTMRKTEHMEEAALNRAVRDGFSMKGAFMERSESS